MLDPRVQLTAHTALQAILDRKGENTIGLNFEKIESYTDFILIASASNPRQVKAIADHVQDTVRTTCGLHPLGVEGYENATWILVDFGAVVVHVFQDEMRGVYHIEDMWPQVRPLSAAQMKSLFSGKEKPAAKPAKVTPLRAAKPKPVKKARKDSPRKAVRKPAKKSLSRKPRRK